MEKVFPVTVRKRTIMLMPEEVESVLKQLFIDDRFREMGKKIIEYYESNILDDSQLPIFSEN